MSPASRRALLLVVIAAAVLRAPALAWSLPKEGRPLSYSPDESTLFLMLERMARPGAGLFAGPDWFQTTLQPLLVGGSCQALSIAGALDLPASRADLLASPGLLAPLYLVGRSISLAMGLATIWVLGRMAADLLGDARAGIAAAAMLTLAPVHVAQSSLNLFNVPCAFWWTLAAWAGWRLDRGGGTRAAALCGAAFGAAVGTKLTATVAAPALLWILASRRSARLAAVWAACAAGALALSFPPMLTRPGGVVSMLATLQGYHGVGEPAQPGARLAVLAGWAWRGAGPPLAALAAIGAVGFLRRPCRGASYAAAHAGGLLLAAMLTRQGSLAVLLPAIPFAAVLAARAVLAGRTHGRWTALAVAAALPFALAEANAHRGRDLRDEAERWMKVCLTERGGQKGSPQGDVVGVPRYAYFAGPPSLYRGLKGDPAVPWRVRPFPEPVDVVVVSDVQWAAMTGEERRNLEEGYRPTERLTRAPPFPGVFHLGGAEASDLDHLVLEIRLWRRR